MGRIQRKRKLAKPSLKFTLINNAFRKYPDDREVCLDNTAGKQEYRRRTIMMAQRQDFVCAACMGRMWNHEDITFDHVIPRGMGGANRDDRIVAVNGLAMNRAVHSWCNSERGSKRLEA